MQSTCVVQELEWDPDIDPDMDHAVRAIFSVQYGKLWLDDGWTSCDTVIDPGPKFALSLDLLQSFTLTQNVKAINCIVKYLMFQGLPNKNMVKARATQEVPIVQISIMPTCRDIPISCEGGSGDSHNIMCVDMASKRACEEDAGGTCVKCVCNADPSSLAGPFCGSPFSSSLLTTTQVDLSEGNDIPYLDSCPRMYLHARPRRYISMHDASLIYTIPGENITATCSAANCSCSESGQPATHSLWGKSCGCGCHADMLTTPPWPEMQQGSDLSWSREESKGYCDEVRSSQSTSSLVLAEAPLQTNWTMPFLNQPTYPRTDVLTGTPIMPREHVPPVCALLNDREPYCDKFSISVPSCRTDKTSYIYHVEDRHDVALSLVNMVISDDDLWTGHMDVDFALAMTADQALSQSTPDTPAPVMDTKSGTFFQLCVRSRATRACAIHQEDALGHVSVLDFPNLEFKVVQTQHRRKKADATCPFAGSPQFACNQDPNDATLCLCRSATYLPINGRTPTERQEAYKAMMFYEVVAKSGVAGAGEQYETGYLDLSYESEDMINYVVTGKLAADEGKVSSIYRGPDIDWYPASPMIVTGTYSAESGRFFLRASTDPVMNPVYTVDVWSRFGSVFLPESPVTVDRGSATCVGEDGVQRPADTCGTMRGTINQVNQALSRVQYVVPTSHPHLNTMSSPHSIYGSVEEYLRVRVNDNGASGVACPACATLGNSVVLDFNVVIVSENDKPVISGPDYLTVVQNQDLRFPGLTVEDPDAGDIVMGRAGPVGGAQVLVSATCGWCTLRGECEQPQVASLCGCALS